MRAVINQTPTFAADWKRLGLTDEDLSSLEAALMRRPTAGPVMKGTGGLRKIRFAPPSWGTGKSGATRVCYLWFPAFSRFYLVTMFGKNEQSNLTAAERNAVAALARRISDGLAKGVPYA